MEIWKDIPSYEGVYRISSDGVIVRIKKCGYETRKPIGQFKSKNGYIHVNLYRNGIKRFLLHRLLAICFIPNPENKLFVNHKDFNRTNNSLGNLEWCSFQDNIDHARANGRFKLRLLDNDARLIKCRLDNGERAVDLARELGVPYGAVCYVKNHRKHLDT